MAAYVVLVFDNEHDFVYCDKRMQITSEHAALDQDGYISVMVKTEDIRLPQGTLIVTTESGRNISIRVSSGKLKEINKQTNKQSEQSGGTA